MRKDILSKLQQSYSSTADLQGAPLYYEVAGAGHPLVLIHAGVADSRMWDEHFEQLATRYRVIRYDIRGFGRSAVPAGEFASYEDVASLLRLLGIDKAHIIGISYGGKIALDFALAYPERVTALVLGAPAVGGYPPSDEVRHFVAAEDEALERGDLDAAADLNVRMWVDGPYRTPEQVDPTARERVWQMQRHAFTIPEPETALERPLTPAAITRLAEIRIPTLILVGDLDIPDKLAVADRLAAEIPGGQKQIISGVAHMVSMEKPAVFRQLVLDFLGTLSD
jgi:3-oxoadipate enol-lactonase